MVGPFFNSLGRVDHDLLAAELAQPGSVIGPDWVHPADAAMRARLLRAIDLLSPEHRAVVERARELAPQVPMQRAGTAEEVARAIVWLLSEDSSYTTGSVVDVTGGR